MTRCSFQNVKNHFAQGKQISNDVNDAFETRKSSEQSMTNDLMNLYASTRKCEGEMTIALISISNKHFCTFETNRNIQFEANILFVKCNLPFDSIRSFFAVVLSAALFSEFLPRQESHEDDAR